MMNQKQLVLVPETSAFPSPPFQPTKDAADSGLTCNNDNSMYFPYSSRKRSREDYRSIPIDSRAYSRMPRLLSSLSEREAAVQIQQQQGEFDCLVTLHTQRLKIELEERARWRSVFLASAVWEAVETKLREKDEEIKRVSKLNWALQERMRSLFVENQLWRGLARSNEAAANSLRTDLERVLTSPGPVEEERRLRSAEDDDAESCCGSSSSDVAAREGKRRMGCKGCEGKREAGVMVMPCRHLCLCATCGGGSSLRSCPVCGSDIAATLHVNFSS